MDLLDNVLLNEWVSILFAALVKSTVILAAAALTTRALRSSSAAFRHLLWAAALSSLLALPLFSDATQPLRIAILPADLFSNEIRQQAVYETVPMPTRLAAAEESKPNLPPLKQQDWSVNFSWQTAVVLAWVLGVVFVLGRFLIGVVTVRRLAGRASELTDTPWSTLSTELSQELDLKRRVRLLRSDKSVMPMTFGVISPGILLPKEADRWTVDRRRIVLLHELIHVKRRDLLTLTLAQIICALYWFNPLVWCAVRRLRTEQELACDERVVSTGVTAADYASHLLEIARGFSADRLPSVVSTTAMASSSQIHDRLCAILRPGHERRQSIRALAVSVLAMSTVFVAAAGTRFVEAGTQGESAVSHVANHATDRVEDLSQSGRNVSALSHVVESRPLSTVSAPVQQREVTTASEQPALIKPEEQDLPDFSAEERARLASNGIGPAYISEMANVGYSPLTADQLIALFSNGVRASYVTGLRSVGISGIDTSDLLSLKTNGVTPELIRSFDSAKHAYFRPTQYASLWSNGVTPSYLRSLNDVGYDSLKANLILEMYFAGVTAEFVRDARSRANTDLSPRDVIALRRQSH